VRNLTRASDELAGAAQTVRRLAESESPTVQHANQALKETARAAEALRKLAELLEQQPDAILRGKRKTENP
jgi:paraquat-inducible protein B